MEHLTVAVLVLVVTAIGLGAIAYSGLYNVGADDHHWPVTLQLLQSVRDRSIHVRSENIEVPNLSEPHLVLQGAARASRHGITGSRCRSG